MFLVIANLFRCNFVICYFEFSNSILNYYFSIMPKTE